MVKLREIAGPAGYMVFIVEAVFVKQPADMDAFAREVYEFCPDVVEQGVGTVKALADEMRRSGILYLWWD